VVVPYGLFIILNLDAFLGQAALQGPRVQFFDLRFWLGNLVNEPSRYASVTQPSALGLGGTSPIGPWMLWLGALPGIVTLVVSRRGGRAEGALPWLSLAVPFAVLALAEQTKAVLYTSLLVPALSVSLACGLDAAVRGRVFSRCPIVIRALQVTTVALLVIVVTEGVRGYRFSLRESERVTPYLEVGRRLASFIPEDGAVLGAWRWWWAFGDRRYFAVNGFWVHSERVSPVNGGSLSFREEVDAKSASYVVVDRDFQADLDRTVAAYRLDAVRFLDECTSVAGVLDDVTYGRMEVRRISCSAGRSPDVPE
jgi:hypothetical protein